MHWARRHLGAPVFCFAETMRGDGGLLEEDVMAGDVKMTLEMALGKLRKERLRLDHQIAAVESALTLDGAGGPAGAGRKRGRRQMSPAARKAVGRRMKAYWAKRKKAAKGPSRGKAAK